MEREPTRGPAASPNPRLVLLSIAMVLGTIVASLLVLRLHSSTPVNLAGNWTAQDGVVTVLVTLTGGNGTYSGNLTAKNAPLPIQGTLKVQVTGSTAVTSLRALGQILTARCRSSTTQMVCTGTGDNKTLTLTFTRP